EAVLHKTTPLQTDLSKLIGKILPDMVQDFTTGFTPVLGIGLSLPAVVDTKNRHIRHQAYPALQARMSKEDLTEDCAELERRLGLRVLLENDVNCAAVAEYRARGLEAGEDFIYVMLGGGLGAGLILDGKLRRGTHFTCGEIGFMVMDPAFAIQDNKSGYMEWEVYRYTLDRFGIDLLAETPAAFPYELIRHIATGLSLVIANLANSLDVSTFVLGGFVYEKIGFSLLKLLNQRLKEMCLQEIRVSGPLCKDACAKGAASLLIGIAFENLLSDRFSIDEGGEKSPL
ncbi:MAG: ROK family protein, partial [Oscillospiraceae bacterium]|nr:ROK family protein [Oscillospiraceae bacterium]